MQYRDPYEQSHDQVGFQAKFWMNPEADIIPKTKPKGRATISLRVWKIDGVYACKDGEVIQTQYFCHHETQFAIQMHVK